MEQTHRATPKARKAPAPKRPSILDPDFIYVEAVKTDVQATWRRFGWTPLPAKREGAK